MLSLARKSGACRVLSHAVPDPCSLLKLPRCCGCFDTKPAYFNNEFVSCSRALAKACDSVCCASGTSLSAPRMDTLLAIVAGSVSRIILRR